MKCAARKSAVHWTLTVPRRCRVPNRKISANEAILFLRQVPLAMFCCRFPRWRHPSSPDSRSFVYTGLYVDVATELVEGGLSAARRLLKTPKAWRRGGGMPTSSLSTGGCSNMHLVPPRFRVEDRSRNNNSLFSVLLSCVSQLRYAAFHIFAKQSASLPWGLWWFVCGRTDNRLCQ